MSLTEAAVIFKIKGQQRLQREAFEKLKMLEKTVPDQENESGLDIIKEREMLSPSKIEELKHEGLYKSEEDRTE